MDLKLIKELHEMSREKSDMEKALAEAGIEFDLGDEGMGDEAELTGDDEFSDEEVDADPELQRIADDYADTADEMEDDELADAIGDDLEALEYEPEEMHDAIQTVMSLLGRESPEDDDMEGEFEPDLDAEMGDEDLDLGREI